MSIVNTQKEVSNAILDAKGKTNEKNLKRLHESMAKMQEQLTAQAQQITMLENNLAMLAQDVANTKQLFGFVHGRGLGPTAKV